MNRVLLTGAAGFIGQQVAPLLRTCGYEVHAVSSRQQSPVAGMHWHHADLLEPGDANRLVANIRPSHLLHLAWYAEPGKYWTAPANISWVEASVRLIRAFREHGGQRAVVAGTCAEYDWHSGPCREDYTELLPASVYGRCKHATQVLLDAYSAISGLSSAWGRVFYLYGPGERVQRLVPGLIRSLLSGKPAECTTGEQTRDFLHVQDAASAFVALLQGKHQGPINIASGHAVSVKEMATEIARQIGRPELLRLGALRSPENEPPSIVGDNDLLLKLGWTPRYDLPGGIAQSIEWWKNHRG